jgi:GT2 family glycosyltransferase
MVSIVTPWLDHQELILDYQAATAGAEVIIVDNGSTSDNAVRLRHMVATLGGIYIRNDTNRGFCIGNNQGLERATHDVVLFLNNDVAAHRGWLSDVERDTVDGALVGPSVLQRLVAGELIEYVEGWCVAARRSVWGALGGWDADAYPFPFWEDVDLSWRAQQLGARLLKAPWPLTHRERTTTRELATDLGSAANYSILEARVRSARRCTTT